jgi:hypothetical protein
MTFYALALCICIGEFKSSYTDSRQEMWYFLEIMESGVGVHNVVVLLEKEDL